MVEAHTGTYTDDNYAEQQTGTESRLAIKLQDNKIYSAPITGEKNYNSYTVRQIHIRDFIPKFPNECITQEDIVNAYLQASSSSTDGWLVTSINTYIGYCGEIFIPLTSDSRFNKKVDYNNEDLYPYNAKIIPLSRVPPPECIKSLVLEVMTGDLSNAQFSGSHKIVLQLINQELKSDIKGPALRNSRYRSEMNLATDFDGLGKLKFQCVHRSNITQVRIESGGNDGWNIASVTTLIPNGDGDYTKLTDNPSFNKWVDGNQEENYSYDAKKLILSLV